jgi:hypothetical protein
MPKLGVSCQGNGWNFSAPHAKFTSNPEVNYFAEFERGERHRVEMLLRPFSELFPWSRFTKVPTCSRREFPKTVDEINFTGQQNLEHNRTQDFKISQRPKIIGR